MCSCLCALKAQFDSNITLSRSCHTPSELWTPALLGSAPNSHLCTPRSHHANELNEFSEDQLKQQPMLQVVCVINVCADRKAVVV